MIALVTELIQAKMAQIDGIKQAPVKLPGDLANDLMPLSFCFPGDGSTTGPARLRITEREFILDCYVAPAAVGLESTAVAKTIQILENVVTYWTELQNDEDEGWVLDWGQQSGYRIEVDKGKPIRDGGWRMDLEWKPEVYYFGFRVWLPMLIRWGSGL